MLDALSVETNAFECGMNINRFEHSNDISMEFEDFSSKRLKLQKNVPKSYNSDGRFVTVGQSFLMCVAW